ncbi:hypothetical protein HMPREF6485_0700 [Segatella buccae ATCC 33574]|uniref:Uncharacterized protein n=1 Tax=Segatella buccae ATCC 33574 TaxID=873513 RepID=E6K566_9BACT|nr:hypothetical protein HMPREF6485_0700 [Segatella buccae ATCC 33574]
MALQKGPNGLSSVALLKCRLGRVRFLMEQMEIISWKELRREIGMEKFRVRLFRNI